MCHPVSIRIIPLRLPSQAGRADHYTLTLVPWYPGTLTPPFRALGPTRKRAILDLRTSPALQGHRAARSHPLSRCPGIRTQTVSGFGPPASTNWARHLLCCQDLNLVPLAFVAHINPASRPDQHNAIQLFSLGL